MKPRDSCLQFSLSLCFHGRPLNIDNYTTSLLLTCGGIIQGEMHTSKISQKHAKIRRFSQKVVLINRAVTLVYA